LEYYILFEYIIIVLHSLIDILIHHLLDLENLGYNGLHICVFLLLKATSNDLNGLFDLLIPTKLCIDGLFGELLHL
jgi:hypothetical protein